MDNKILLVFGILFFYLVFGLLYLGIGNTLYRINAESLPDLSEKGYSNPALNDDTETLLGFVVNGVNGYEDENLNWINYIFIFLSAMLIFTFIIVLLHG